MREESNGPREEETSQLQDIARKYSRNVMNTIAVRNECLAVAAKERLAKDNTVGLS